jgi:hypothetical protein
MQRRRLLTLGALAPLAALAATPAEAAIPAATIPADWREEAVEMLDGSNPFATPQAEPAQYGWGPPPRRRPPSRRRRRPICRWENVRVRYRDRWGNVFWRVERRQICR